MLSQQCGDVLKKFKSSGVDMVPVSIICLAIETLDKAGLLLSVNLLWANRPISENEA